MALGLTSEKQKSKIQLRLDKFLSNMGCGTRSEVKNFIKQSQVSVNGKVVKDPMFKVCPNVDVVVCIGKEVVYEQFIYLLLNKPKGYISATEDNRHRTVLELVPDKYSRNDLSPVGRLDIDTTGLLLITDDGSLNHMLLRPQNHVVKKYVAVLEENRNEVLDQNTVELFENGVVFNDGTQCLPAKLEIIDQNTVQISVVEGKFHQIKKMMSAVGRKVIELERIQFGSLKLNSEFEQGQIIKLNKQDVESLKNSMGEKIF